MKRLFTHIAPAFLLLLFCLQAKATHVVGGEVTYQYLGNNDYEITLSVYFDCENGNPSAIADDDEASIAVYDISGNIVYDNIVFGNGWDTLASTLSTDCITPPQDVCVSVNRYVTTVNLPPTFGGYHIAYQRCCRNGTLIQNIQAPGATGATYYTWVPDPSIATNNSKPVFTNWPPIYVCQDLQLRFDHSATDADGDSLVYELCTPFEGASSTNPKPQPPAAPPYDTVVWVPPYSLADVMGGIPLVIDPQTGELTATPNTLGNFVVGICVFEFRNGQLIGFTKRDFQFNVVDCQPQVVSAFGAAFSNNQVICNDTVLFNNNSFGALEYFWDFGVITSTTDTTSVVSPTYIFPDTGVYNVMLIARDDSCADTTIIPIIIGPPVMADAGPDQKICNGDDAQINATGSVFSSFTWTPTGSLNNPGIPNPIASPSVTTTYNLTVDNGFCTATDAMQVIVEDSFIVADFLPDTTSGCAEFTVNFTNTSAGGLSWFWDFGDSTAPASGQNVSHTYTSAGIYEPMLIIADSNSCNDFDTATKFIFVIDDTTYTLADDSICMGESVAIGLPYDSSITYLWSPAATLDNDTAADPIATPPASTVYSVVISNGVCSDTISKVVEVGPALVVQLADTTICLGDTILIGILDIGDTYQWTPAAGLDNDQISSPFAFPTLTSTYILHVDNQFCEREDTMTITVSDLEGKAGPGVTICKGDTVTIGGPDEGYTYSWTPAPNLSNTNISNPVASPDTNATYVVTVTDGFCTKMDTVLVTVLGGNIRSNPPDSICEGDSVTIGVTPNVGVQYFWDPPTGLTNPNVGDPGASPATTTNYILSMSAGGNCLDTLYHTVEVGPAITFNPDPAGVNCGGNGIQIGVNGDNSNTYTWTPATGLSATDIPMPVANPTESTSYTLEVKNDFCEKIYTVDVAVQVASLEADFAIEPFFSCDQTVFNLVNNSSGATRYEWQFADGGRSSEETPQYSFEDANEMMVTLVAYDMNDCTDSAFVTQSNLSELLTPGFSNVITPNEDGMNDCLQFVTGELDGDCYNLQIHNRWGDNIFESTDSKECWSGIDKKSGQPLNKGVYFYILTMRDLTVTGYVELLRN